jgi:uncharacterized protein
MADLRQVEVKRVLVDTEPIVALLLTTDASQRGVDELKSVSPLLFTCWPVLTEAAWLLRGRPVAALLRAVADGIFRILQLDETDAEGIVSVMNSYPKLRPQLADATLVHLARREGIDAIFTLDRRDFSVLRGNRGRSFRKLPLSL